MKISAWILKTLVKNSDRCARNWPEFKEALYNAASPHVSDKWKKVLHGWLFKELHLKQQQEFAELRARIALIEAGAALRKLKIINYSTPPTFRGCRLERNRELDK